ncbi:uncharacterized protein EV422DRAFT_523473, partial [Fimicolochytrium jonesii]|uniref:uncharacterized protein n=1 Tax=Fimicolochytrium jonesii TaxID=1396493 RepID=UPI0022FE0DAA
MDNGIVATAMSPTFSALSTSQPPQTHTHLPPLLPHSPILRSHTLGTSSPPSFSPPHYANPHHHTHNHPTTSPPRRPSTHHLTTSLTRASMILHTLTAGCDLAAGMVDVLAPSPLSASGSMASLSASNPMSSFLGMGVSSMSVLMGSPVGSFGGGSIREGYAGVVEVREHDGGDGGREAGGRRRSIERDAAAAGVGIPVGDLTRSFGRLRMFDGVYFV